LPVYEKFGYRGPICFIDEDQAQLVRDIFTLEELSILEYVASTNEGFQRLRNEVDAMPDLTKEEIDRTWEEIEKYQKPSANNPR